MNLFLLSLIPQENAEMHCDQHVVKMILEGTQIVCTVLHIDRALDTYCPRPLEKHELALVRDQAASYPDWYKPTHVNHPLVVWARQSLEHFSFVRSYVSALHEEYRYRFQKACHKSGALCETLPFPNHVPSIPGPIKFVLCMPEEYQNPSDPVQSYRDFYKGAKTSFVKYKYRAPPTWLIESMDNHCTLS